MISFAAAYIYSSWPHHSSSSSSSSNSSNSSAPGGLQLGKSSSLISSHFMQMQVLEPSLHHNGSSDDDSHLPHAMQVLTNAFNPVISHDSPPMSHSIMHQGNQHPQQAYYSLQSGYQQTQRSVHPAQHGVPNICLCPQVARVPRPRNAFILYRQHHHAVVVAEHPGKTNPEISKIIGEQWRQLSGDEKAVWQKLGDEEKKSHLERFPDYRYQPRRNTKRNGNDFQSNSHSNSHGPPGSSTISICSKCHGQTPNSRGVLFPKPQVSLENSGTYPQQYRQPPSSPSGNTLAPSLMSSSQLQQSASYEPQNSYLSGITLPPASTAVASASPPSLHHLPPILPLPKDDVLSTSASSATSSVAGASPPRPFAGIRTRSQDDARQGVEALLSLTHASGGTPSPEPAAAKLTTLPPCSSISSIINSESVADCEAHHHKRHCRSDSYERDYSRYSQTPPDHDSDSESQAHSQKAGYYIPPISASVPMQQSTYQDNDDSRLTTTLGRPFYLAVPTSEKLREVATIGVHLPRDKPRGAVVAIDGDPAAIKPVVAELVRRIDQLAVCEANRAFEEAGVEEEDDMPEEAKLLTKALAVHKELNGVYTFVKAQKSVLLDRYISSFATDSSKMLSCVEKARTSSSAVERTEDAMAVSSITNGSPSTLLTHKKVAEDWYWCANLYRGTVVPDLIIYVCFEAKDTLQLSLADGKTKALLVSGIEHIGIMEQEVRAIVSEVGKVLS
ncbi:hypothetical protein V1521DRAFT_449453 [Lipomyces starkeyi]